MVYVHVPFCRSFCTYCGFYSEICPEGSRDIDVWIDAVCAEIDARRGEIETSGRELATVYIGGGTPSVLPLSVLGRLVGALRDAGAFPCREFTLEANPDDVVRGGAPWAAAVRALGVDRISVGVQSFDDRVLSMMNRRHGSSAAVDAWNILRGAGFDNLSLDLIFGFPDADWEYSVGRALELRPEHISAYQLSIEPGSALEKMVCDGRFREASQELCASQYELLCSRLSAAGYHHYEISNFALPGREAVHNSGYWRGLPYVGLGPAAHSFDGNRRFWNPDDMKRWSADPFEKEGETLSDAQKVTERIMLGLRTDDGVDGHFLAEHGGEKKVLRLLEDGFLEKSPKNANFRIPEKYFFVSDSIIGELI